MRNKIGFLSAGCDAIVEEFLHKSTPKAQWMALEEMLVDIEKFGAKSVGIPNYTAKQTNAITSVIKSVFEKRVELKNANLIRSIKNAKESVLLWSTKVQILLAIIKFSPCHNAKEIVIESKKIKEAIIGLIYEYVDAYEIDIGTEVEKMETGSDVMQSFDLLVMVFRRTVDTILFSLTLSLEAKQGEVEDLKLIENTLDEGIKNNDIKPGFYNKISNQMRSLVQRMQKDIAEQQNEIKDLKNSKAELEDLIIIDDLTKISNRRGYKARFDLEIKRIKRKKIPLFLLVIDLDGFKGINDTYGHLVGDKILKTVAQVLKSNLREIDFLARWGGEEFVVLCPEINVSGVANVAEKLRKTIAEHKFTANYRVKGKKEVIKKERIHITISLGITEILNRQDAKTAFISAEEAMYQAKEQGKNKVVFYQKKTTKIKPKP